MNSQYLKMKKIGVKNMDWADLQENWVPLSDPDKFCKYAQENAPPDFWYPM
jgi:hypothetical protein